MIGEVVGSYKLLRKLGAGSTGETYLAEHQQTGQRAAAKVFLPSLSADREACNRCFAEARASSQVNHVGVADLLDCGVHGNGRAYLVMELLAGKTLTDALLEAGRVSEVEGLADIGWQLATVLAAAHARQLVHRALGPAAVFLTFPAEAARPLVKLTDFGMANFSRGVPLYRSPEEGRGFGTTDHRTDVYSLGCILFEMACGRPPFERESPAELNIAHASEVAPAASSLLPSIPPAIDGLIGRMMAKDPGMRPQTMTEVAAVLETFCRSPAPGHVPSTHAPTALLPPEPVPAAPPAWVTRVQQRTAILPSAHAVAANAANVSSRRSPASTQAGAAPTSLISLPIVILTASVLVTVGSGVLLLRGKKPSSPEVTEAKPASDVRVRLESFRPPPPAPTTALPPDARPAIESSTRDTLQPTEPKASTRTKPGRKGPAPRW